MKTITYEDFVRLKPLWLTDGETWTVTEWEC